MKKNLLFLFILICTIQSLAQSPKREMRGAWIATVLNLDWPSSNSLSTDKQKAELISLLDNLKAAGVNAVFFQVRVESDAFYNSPYEPWSYWLTGTQGKAPNPFYDPLQFAIEETHKRGMELHAWINPYRAVRNVSGAYPTASNHVTKTHPDWLLQVGNVKILNPGLPEVRDYVTKIIMDIVRRYDIDGIHFDDYFYESGITTEDASTFNTYSRGFTNIGDWRRDNVNLFVKEVYDSIQVVKPYVKFGISPPGMYKANNPSGICGYYSYSDVYADGLYWLQSHIIDYLAPEIYHAIGSSISCGSTDYKLIMDWWSSRTYGRDLYIGQAAYRVSEWSPSELPNQIRLDRSTPNVMGGILYRSKMGVIDNPKGFLDTLKNDLYKNPALIPVMKWKDTLAPNMPLNVRFARIGNLPISGLVWDVPLKASDGDTAMRYAVYKFGQPSVPQSSIDDPSKIIEISGQRYYIPPASGSGSNMYFGITALDRNWNESGLSNLTGIDTPQVPLLSVPYNNALNQRDTIVMKWNYADFASIYNIQVSTDSTFSFGIILQKTGLQDTTWTLTNVKGFQKYFWRVRAQNFTGAGSYSAVYNFTTGFPEIPQLVSPPHATLDLSINPVLSWAKTPYADKYQLQLSHSRTFTGTAILFDSVEIADTVLQLNKLDYSTTYFWHVRAGNQFGFSEWSDPFGFKTEANPVFVKNETSLPTEYKLSQNYPNPFNPATIINYSLPFNSTVKIDVFNILGVKVKELLNNIKNAGNYQINFNANGLSSGVYFYILEAKSLEGNKIYRETKKMIILK